MSAADARTTVWLAVPGLLILTVIIALALPASASAQGPDPDDFTPPGYRFCGWQDFVNGGWAMDWSDDLGGAYLVAFARKMSCQSARRNIARLRYTQTAPYRPVRPGYRCSTLENGHEYSDVRCSKRGRPSTAFRFQTGA